MGAQCSACTCWGGLAAAERRSLKRAGPSGKYAISGRYHRLPRTLEDDYEPLHKVLGTGFNGEVHLFKSRSTPAKVAVKGFNLHGISYEKMQLLEAELEIFLAMDHPHVARLVDVYESRTRLDLVMELMEGGMLFDRVVKKRGFSEREAADAAWQMLRAVNYLHRHGVVHRDIKLENFLYDSPSSEHLKLIDFGFSKIWKPNTRLSLSCGTLFYNAPEVLCGSYTSQCDLWSIGVTVFILLFGYMPFSGSLEHQTAMIKKGEYEVRAQLWNRVSPKAHNFVKSCLVVNPDSRITAQQALNHPWLSKRHKLNEECQHLNLDILQALIAFRKNSTFRRACFEMMAWSLTNEERGTVSEAFLELDEDCSGTVTVAEFKKVMSDKFDIVDGQAADIFVALDCDQTEHLHYSEFLAAMVSSRIHVHDDMLRATFRRFDQRNDGFITVDDLRHVLGNTFHGEDVKELLKEADLTHDGKISYPEWVAFLQGSSTSKAVVPAALTNLELGPEHAKTAAHALQPCNSPMRSPFFSRGSSRTLLGRALAAQTGTRSPGGAALRRMASWPKPKGRQVLEHRR